MAGITLANNAIFSTISRSTAPQISSVFLPSSSRVTFTTSAAYPKSRAVRVRANENLAEAEGKVADAYENAKQATSDAKDSTLKNVEEVVAGAKDAAESFSDQAKEGAEKASKSAQELAGSLSEKANEGFKSASDAAQDLGDKAKQAAGDAWEAAKDSVEKAKE